MKSNSIPTFSVKPTVFISSRKKIVNIEEGSKSQFECSAQGFPKPQVHWILKSNPGKVLSKVQTLFLHHVKPENAGEYICVATNSEGRSEDGLQINVFCEFNLITLNKFYKVSLQINQEQNFLGKAHPDIHLEPQ